MTDQRSIGTLDNMKPLVIAPMETDLETQRITSALVTQGAKLVMIRRDSPVSLLIDRFKLRSLAAESTVIHAFGGYALAVALGLCQKNLIFTPVGFPSNQIIAWLRAIQSYYPIRIVCTSETARRTLVERGVNFSSTSLIRTGVSFARITTRSDAGIREKLGFRHDHKVVFCPLEITRTSGHAHALWAMSILQVLEPHFRLLLWSKEPCHPLVDLADRLIDPALLRVVQTIEPESFFAAADLILLTPDAPISLYAVAASMVSSKPIISTLTPQICELLEDRHTALLVNSTTPRNIAHRIMDCVSDASLSWKIADRARAEAYDHLTQSRMIESYQSLYAALSGSGNTKDVSLPILTNPRVV
ncbi:MAG: hypothetical protein KatS3mg104_2748 [Phycisphaerae bacterium]|jgi:glycosyltransferase involved in cell wall biosynthesis|nr:MAG: hypothetical protein KatS3mg104_2748 [Phycisphaerae bacterium]